MAEVLTPDWVKFSGHTCGNEEEENCTGHTEQHCSTGLNCCFHCKYYNKVTPDTDKLGRQLEIHMYMDCRFHERFPAAGENGFIGHSSTVQSSRRLADYNVGATRADHHRQHNSSGIRYARQLRQHAEFMCTPPAQDKNEKIIRPMYLGTEQAKHSIAYQKQQQRIEQTISTQPQEEEEDKGA